MSNGRYLARASCARDEISQVGECQPLFHAVNLFFRLATVFQTEPCGWIFCGYGPFAGRLGKALVRYDIELVPEVGFRRYHPFIMLSGKFII